VLYTKYVHLMMELPRLFLDMNTLAAERQVILANFLSSLSSVHGRHQERIIAQNDEIISLLRTIANRPASDTGGTG